MDTDHKIKCPYCGVEMPKPKATKKCKACNQKVHVVQFLNPTHTLFLTTKERDATRKKRREEYLTERWLKRIQAEYKLTINEIEAKRRALQEKGDFSGRDLVWALFNYVVVKMGRDFQRLKMIYYSMAIFLNEEGKDFSNVLQLSAKMSLLFEKQGGIVRSVSISSCGGGCDSCGKLNGKKFSLDDALRLMPIPNKNCSFVLDDGPKGFCRCMYVPEIDF